MSVVFVFSWTLRVCVCCECEKKCRRDWCQRVGVKVGEFGEFSFLARLFLVGVRLVLCK